ncbi:conserved hypothetical protein [Trichinella spiralis]|uniref:hypothetical protein n=1 Tax=Trichinella spiralis TaxID=6334 RepID=UPI0001EFC5E4|nr:conserved hypothetical protein [Trichinella spiralis]
MRSATAEYFCTVITVISCSLQNFQENITTTKTSQAAVCGSVFTDGLFVVLFNFSNSGDLKINTTNAFKRNKENRNLLLLNSVKWELKNFMEIAFHKLKESTAYLVFN